MLKDNLVGRRFGKLVVIEESQNTTRLGTRWVCKCDCGNKKDVASHNLKNGHIKSCGCFRREINRKDMHVSGINSAIRAYKQNSKNRSIFWGISNEDFIRLSSSNCFYCGAIPSNISRGSTKEKGYSSYIYNGLDRVDTSKDYTIDNVVPCCYKCNARKKDFSIENMVKSLRFLGYSVIRADDLI